MAPNPLLPSSVSETRVYVTNGIDRILVHPWLVKENDKIVLRAMERLFITDDEVVGKLLATLKAMESDVTSLKESNVARSQDPSSVKHAIDWTNLKTKLEDLVTKLPALAPALVQLLAILQGKLPATESKLTALKGVGCTHECYNHCLDHLECQREAVLTALSDNLCLEHCLRTCCPDDDRDDEVVK